MEPVQRGQKRGAQDLKAIRMAGWGLLVLVLTIMIGLMTWEPFFAPAPAAPPTRAYSAQITRDEFGVPHIHGKTDPDVAEQLVKPQPWMKFADPDPQRPGIVVDAHRDHRVIEPRIAHSGHGEQQTPGEGLHLAHRV